VSNEPAIGANEAMRLRRLVFYAADTDKINALLTAFVKKSGALSAMVIDQEGHMVARQGFKIAGGDPTALAALVAASFVSTRQVAKLLGEAEFTTMSQVGGQHAIHVQLIGTRTLEVAVFPTAIKPGMIQVYCTELAKELDVVLSEAAARKDDGDRPKLDAEFSKDMKDQLDKMFSDL
jgi:predicted regulator of Ras-like GTPase activity (Roadblock/LC7/MglB family)